MRRLILGFTTVLAMSCSALHAQSGQKISESTEVTPRSGVSSLLARSEMQIPKPIPITRPLRFQEIPASLGARQGGEKQPRVIDNFPTGAKSSPDNDVELPVIQTSSAH